MNHLGKIRFTLIELLVACQPKLPVRGRRPIQAKFTLIELLVVIAIIAILAALLLPALKHAKEMAKDVVCTNQQKQLCVAVLGYASDSNSYLPYNDMWGFDLFRTAGTPPVSPPQGLREDWPAHYTGLGLLKELEYVPSGLTVFWCGNESARQGAECGSGNSTKGLKGFSKETPTSTIRNDYWYRCGWFYEKNLSELIEKLNPDTGLLMCGAWKDWSGSASYVHWQDLHNTRGFNLAFIDGHVEWYSYKANPIPDVWGDTGTNRYRPDFPRSTLNKAVSLLRQ
jgi:prepilin-type N-terminal cleavage/methylation domain-containing protein/prepilin-type processing-associated H-X9-DG protein